MSTANDWRAIDGCPCPADVAPHAYLVVRRAKQTFSSIGRGDDPHETRILHRHGKHNQRELYGASPAQRAAWGVTGTPNKPGHSTHERRNDGVAWPHVKDGAGLHTWQQGFDSGPNTSAGRRAIDEAAEHYGYRVFHAYDSGVEGHHWGFKVQPVAKTVGRRAQISLIRKRLPKT